MTYFGWSFWAVNVLYCSVLTMHTFRPTAWSTATFEPMGNHIKLVFPWQLLGCVMVVTLHVSPWHLLWWWIALASTADEGLRERLVENALEDAVSAFDGFGREVCRVSLEKLGRVPSFQNIAAARDTLYHKLGFDLRAPLTDDEWRFIVGAFQKRHVLAHKMGVVDQKYIDATNDASAVVAVPTQSLHNRVGRRFGVAVNC